MTAVRAFRLMVDDGSAVDHRLRAFGSLRAAVGAMRELPEASQRYTWIVERRHNGQPRVVHVKDGKPVTEWAEALMGGRE